MFQRLFFILGTALMGVMLAVAPARAVQTTFAYDPQSPMTLGAGISDADPVHEKYPCITFKPQSPSGAASTTLATTVATDSESLKQNLGFDLSLDAHYLAFSASGDLHQALQQSDQSDSVSIVVQGRTDYQPEIVTNLSYTPTAHNVLLSPQAFQQMCGDRFISQVLKAASISVILVMEGVDSQTSSSIRASISAGANFGVGGGSLKATIDSEMSKAIKENRLSVQVYAIGGAGIGAYQGLVDKVISADIAGGNLDLDSIAHEIDKVIGQFTAANAAPVGFVTTQYPGAPSATVWTDNKQRLLDALTKQYRTYASALAAIGVILSDPSMTSVLTTADLSSLTGAQAPIDTALNSISSAFDKCQKDNSTDADCAMPASLPTVPAIIADTGPSIDYRVVWSGPGTPTYMLSHDDSQTLLLGLNPFDANALLTAVKAVHANANYAGEVVVFRASNIKSAQYALFIDPSVVNSAQAPTVQEMGGPSPPTTAGAVVAKWQQYTPPLSPATMHSGFSGVVMPTGEAVAFDEYGIPATIDPHQEFLTLCKFALEFTIPNGDATIALQVQNKLNNTITIPTARIHWEGPAATTQSCPQAWLGPPPSLHWTCFTPGSTLNFHIEMEDGQSNFNTTAVMSMAVLWAMGIPTSPNPPCK